MTTNQKPTRCKPGDRARVIAARLPENVGRIVTVIKPYREGELIHGSTWVCDKTSWVVASLSFCFVTVNSTGVRTREEDMVVVFNDAALQPLHDDEGGIEDAATRIVQLKRSRKSPKVAVKS